MQIDIRSTTNVTKVDNSTDCSCRFYKIWVLISSLALVYIWYGDKLEPSPIVEDVNAIMFVTDDTLSAKQKLVTNSQVIQQYCDSNNINFRVYPYDANSDSIEPWAATMLREGSKHSPCLLKYDGDLVEVLNIPDNVEKVMEQIK